MNGHGETLETWLAFHEGERCRTPRLICVDCGADAEGNVEVAEGPLCDKCGEFPAEGGAR